MVAIKFQIRGLDSLLQAHVCTSTQSLSPPHPVSFRHSQNTSSCHHLTPRGSISFFKIPEEEHVLQMCLVLLRSPPDWATCYTVHFWTSVLSTATTLDDEPGKPNGPLGRWGLWIKQDLLSWDLEDLIFGYDTQLAASEISFCHDFRLPDPTSSWFWPSSGILWKLNQ